MLHGLFQSFEVRLRTHKDSFLGEKNMKSEELLQWFHAFSPVHPLLSPDLFSQPGNNPWENNTQYEARHLQADPRQDRLPEIRSFDFRRGHRP
jgi:hypothetical protein